MDAQGLFGDDALIDAHAAAAGGDESVSKWHERVRTGEAPQPVVRRPRFTRWRLGDVREFWREFAKRAAADSAARAQVIDKATKASDAARAKRACAAA